MSLSRLLASLAFLALFVQLPVSAALNDTAAQLSFRVSSGGNDNFFLRDNVTSAQLLLTSHNSTSPLRRLVVALPAGNSGALAYFLPLDSSEICSSLAVRLVNGSFQTVTREFNNAGVQADLSIDGNATLGVTIIGAVRAMRGKPVEATCCACFHSLTSLLRLRRRKRNHA